MGSLDNVLFVSASAPPKNAPESIQVGRYLRQLVDSYEVSLVTTPVDDGWRRYDPGLEPDYPLAQTVICNFPCRRFILGALRRVDGSFSQKPDGDFWFQYMQRQVVRRLRKKPDLIYSRSTPYSSALLAHRLKQVYRVPWVMHLSDPWADNPFHRHDERIDRYQQQAEAACFAAADRISLTTDLMIAHYAKKYPAYAQKLILSNNVYDDSSDPHATPQDMDGPLIFVCTGAFYGDRSPLPLLQALASLQKSHPAVLRRTQFIFAGNADAQNQARFAAHPFENVRFMGAVSYEEAGRLQEGANVLVSIDADRPGDIYKVFLPSKILDYMSRQRRILALTPVGSSTARLLAQGYGAAFPHADIDGIAGHICQLVESFESGDTDFFRTPPPPEQYSPRYNVQKLSEAFGELMTAGCRGGTAR